MVVVHAGVVGTGSGEAVTDEQAGPTVLYWNDMNRDGVLAQERGKKGNITRPDGTTCRVCALSFLAVIDLHVTWPFFGEGTTLQKSRFRLPGPQGAIPNWTEKYSGTGRA